MSWKKSGKVKVAQGRSAGCGEKLENGEILTFSGGERWCLGEDGRS